MNYEDKYKQALERAKDMLSYKEVRQEDMEYLFPELAEDEDERIRKGIIRNLQYLMDRSEGFVKEDLQERIAWLEKQGKTLNPDRVIEWMKTHGNLWPRVTIKINEVIDKFKQDFDL